MYKALREISIIRGAMGCWGEPDEVPTVTVQVNQDAARQDERPPAGGSGNRRSRGAALGQRSPSIANWLIRDASAPAPGSVTVPTQIIAPIISAAAALGGVGITLWMTGRRERRKADDERQRERQRVNEQRWQWNRTQRLNAYVQLISATSALAARFKDSADLAQEHSLVQDDLRSHTATIEQLVDEVRVQVHLVSLIGSQEMIGQAYSARSGVRHVPGRFATWSRLLVVGPKSPDEIEQADNVPGYFSAEIRRLYGIVNALVEAAQAELHPDLEADAEQASTAT